MINQKFDINKSFQAFPAEKNADEINFKCDKLITELSGINLRIKSLQNLTDYHGPSIDAARSIDIAIKCLPRQKR